MTPPIMSMCSFSMFAITIRSKVPVNRFARNVVGFKARLRDLFNSDNFFTRGFYSAGIELSPSLLTQYEALMGFRLPLSCALLYRPTLEDLVVENFL